MLTAFGNSHPIIFPLLSDNIVWNLLLALIKEY